MADDAPRMIFLTLDGAGPLGDPYQVNSANHGPYGDAITQELIPFIEAKYRGIGTGKSRVLDGGSTGGWVSLALQVFYPDVFNGCWSSCPDGVDFRDFQLVNIYEDRNAYVNEDGFERPARGRSSGDVKYTMRHELRMENLLGAGRFLDAIRRPVGGLERDVRASRGRRRPRAPVGPEDRRDRPIGRRPLEEIRPADGPRT